MKKRIIYISVLLLAIMFITFYKDIIAYPYKYGLCFKIYSYGYDVLNAQLSEKYYFYRNGDDIIFSYIGKTNVKKRWIVIEKESSNNKGGKNKNDNIEYFTSIHIKENADFLIDAKDFKYFYYGTIKDFSYNSIQLNIDGKIVEPVFAKNNNNILFFVFDLDQLINVDLSEYIQYK